MRKPAINTCRSPGSLKPKRLKSSEPGAARPVRFHPGHGLNPPDRSWSSPPVRKRITTAGKAPSPALSASIPTERSGPSNRPVPAKTPAQSFTLNTATMNESIPQLQTFDEPSLDAAFATLAEEVRTADTTDVE